MDEKKGFMRSVYRVLRLERTELAWVFYDIGNSAFVLMLSSFIPIYFGALYKSAEIARLGGAEMLSESMLERIGNSATELFSLGTVITTLIVAVLSPILGAMADYRNMKKRLFTGALAVGILFGAMMGVVNTWAAFLLMFILAKIGYSACNVFYDSMLTDVTTEQRYDSVSSKGYAWGYIGSCIPFIAGVAVYLVTPDGALAVKIAQAITIVWWIVMTVPLLKYVHQTHYIDAKPQGIVKTFRHLGVTARKIAGNKHMLFFMLAYFFYIDGVYTIISMAASYGDGLGLDSTSMILALLVTQFVAFPFALAAGRIAARIGAINLIRVYILIYIGVCIFAFFLQYEWHFWVMAVVVGMAQGGIQALSRSYFGKLVPKENSNEFFGFFDIFGKAADILGPLLILLVSMAVTGGVGNGITQGVRYGVLSITVLFGVGLVLLHFMNREIKRGT